MRSGIDLQRETGLYYLSTRYLNANICRFLNCDVFFGKQLSVYASNLYTYCHNRPIVQADSNGTSSRFCVIAVHDGGASSSVDITKRLDKVMEEGYTEMQEYFANHTFIETVLYFVKNVQTNGKWDLKSRDDWNLKLGVAYVYNGIPLRWDEPGNISFGYIGSAIFDADMLKFGAGVYQVYSGTSSWEYASSYFDDPLDSMCIEYGYYLKNKVRTVFPGVYETLEEFEAKFKEVH